MPGRNFQISARPALLILLAACVANLVMPAGANAQAAVVVTRLADMSFGDVAAGSTTPVAYDEAGASAFRLDVSGMSGFQIVDISFMLPTQIVNGADSVPISFGAADAAWSYSNDPAVAISFNPQSGVQVPKDGNLFSIYVWVGGTVDPDQSTPSQQYSNTFTLDAEIQ